MKIFNEMTDVNTKIVDIFGGLEAMIEHFSKAFIASGDLELERLNVAYVEKLGKRTLENFNATLVELNGQIATNLFKFEHNLILLTLLADLTVPEVMVKHYSRLIEKSAVFMDTVDDFDLAEGRDHYVYMYGSDVGIIGREDFVNNFGSTSQAGFHEEGRLKTAGKKPHKFSN